MSTTAHGAFRARTTPGEMPGESTPIQASGADYDEAYAALQALVPEDHLLLYVLVD